MWILFIEPFSSLLFNAVGICSFKSLRTAMGSLRFSFSLPRPPKPPHGPAFRRAVAAAAAVAVGAGVGLAISVSLRACVSSSETHRRKPCSDASSRVWASLSLDDSPPPETIVDPRSGAAFPISVDGRRRLLGSGLRQTITMWGSKIIDLAFGVYADDCDIKRLSKKYGTFSASELKGNKQFIADVLDQDLRMTIRLKIINSRVNIGSEFAKDVGSRLRKFSGSDDKELLQSFVTLFRDEFKLRGGSILDFSRQPGYILQVRIDGKEVGKIQSKLLCKSVLDLYLGEDAVDKQAREDILTGLASRFQERSAC